MSIHDHKPLVTVKSVHADGDLALYTNGRNARTIHLDLGDDIVTTSDTDLAPLAKAILNAVEPEALVENQKDAEPEPYKPQVGDRVQWLGFVESNDGEHIKSVGALGTVSRLSRSPRVIEVDWDDYRKETTYKPNVGPAAATPERDLAAEVNTLKGTFETIRTGLDAVRQAAAQAQTTATTANDKADRAYDRIAALEAAADTEIRVGDTVRVEPADWNIGGSWVGHEVKTGKVVWVAGENYRGRSKYLVSVTHPEGYINSVYALKATKVVSRG